jgi:hypothetical protein
VAPSGWILTIRQEVKSTPRVPLISILPDRLELYISHIQVIEGIFYQGGRDGINSVGVTLLREVQIFAHFSITNNWMDTSLMFILKRSTCSARNVDVNKCLNGPNWS